MQFITHLLFGFLMAFIGVSAPGMLNMTSLRVKIEKNSRSAFLFATGAALIVIPQALIALSFAKYFVKNPEVIEQLKTGGVFVLLALSVFFFFQARKKIKAEGTKRKGNYFFIGMFLSSINMLAIPYYFFFSSFLDEKDLIIMEQPYISIFVAGAFLGTFALFSVYIQFAKIIERRVQFIARNINYVLSILFFVLSILALTSLNN
jgi:threonine/homoserine/homoserine lactone efflux protein